MVDKNGKKNIRSLQYNFDKNGILTIDIQRLLLSQESLNQLSYCLGNLAIEAFSSGERRRFLERADQAGA
jgi:hypothetical protein